MNESIRTHLRTVAVILLGFGILVALIVFPKLALAAWIGFWIVLGLAVCVWIYGLVYLTLSGQFPYMPVEYVAPKPYALVYDY